MSGGSFHAQLRDFSDESKIALIVLPTDWLNRPYFSVLAQANILFTVFLVTVYRNNRVTVLFAAAVV
jgi:hypothetical protein